LPDRAVREARVSGSAQPPHSAEVAPCSSQASFFARLLACCLAYGLTSASQAQDRPGDFYVLSLSWSPTWCATDTGAGDSPQCDEGAGHGFIVHGLWPQYEAGYPQFCAGNRPDRIPSELADSVTDIMPDRQLVFHQWRKHGTCSGLAAKAYFATIRAALGQVAIPASFRSPPREEIVSAGEVEQAFLQANRGLKPGGIAVSCAAGWLEEVRICLTRELAFRTCGEVDQRGCRQARLRLPPPG
jgi:ribonuclease T2